MKTYNDQYNELHQLPQSDPLFSSEKILKIIDIYKLQLGKFVFESHNNIGPSQFHNIFNPVTNVHQYHTRYGSSGNFFVTHAHTTQYGLKNIKNSGTRLWFHYQILLKIVPPKMFLSLDLKSIFYYNISQFSFVCFHRFINTSILYKTCFNYVCTNFCYAWEVGAHSRLAFGLKWVPAGKSSQLHA